MITASSPELFFDLFDQFDQQGPPPGFETLRQSGRNRFRELSFPNARTEDWRFTNLAGLFKKELVLPARYLPSSGGPLPPPIADNPFRLVFTNGQFSRSQSRLEGIPPGVVLGHFAQPGADRNQRLQVFLGQVADYQNHIFSALNLAMFQEGAYIIIPDGKVLESPLEVIFQTQANGPAVITNPRLLIVAGKASQATVYERYLGQGSYFTNGVTEIALGEGATVNHGKIQQETKAAFHIAGTHVLVDARANFTSNYFAWGGGLVRNEVHVRFDGEGAEATLNGLYLGGGNQHLDQFTVIDHAKPHCQSHELYKGILDGQAHGVFHGKIHVREGAQKTDAKQTNKVLLLSDQATINTKPQLEIFADDVKCTHGATIGQLDPQQLYYLRSRGIGLAQATAMLTFAFANDLVSRIPLDGLRSELESILMPPPA